MRRKSGAYDAHGSIYSSWKLRCRAHGGYPKSGAGSFMDLCDADRMRWWGQLRNDERTSAL